MRRVLLMMAGVLMLSAGAQATPGDILGRWHIATSDMVIELTPCDAAICGRLVGLPDPAARDLRNPDADLAERPLCRLQVLEVVETSGIWQGQFYNPEDGTDYSVELSLTPDGELQVWGWTGVAMLTRVMPLAVVWSPLPAEGDGCAAAPVS